MSISYQLDLIVRLIDTTTGFPVTERQVIFYENGSVRALLPRDDGVYILLNRGRQDMELAVRAKGYLDAKAKICYEELSERYPEVYFSLIPKIPERGYHDMVTLEGTMKGMESIDAVSLHNPIANAANYNAKRQQLRLFHTRELWEADYALLYEEQEMFEEFRIKTRKDELTLRLTAPLQKEPTPELPIARIVRGRVDPSGKYLLQVREDSSGTEYLVRYVVKGQTKFKKIIFSEEEERRL